ncbi:helix-turn-helix domain-containing protein [Streptomyces sp. NPDC006552]|uniref:GlxA family transcriptional regulator n=1 Tax=Streptomyces sp. NPDC006552 TaxID=3157179 RepID=UPI0033B0BFA8
MVIVDEDTSPFELACASEILSAQNPGTSRSLYDLVLCSPTHPPRVWDGPVRLNGITSLSVADQAHTLVVATAATKVEPHGSAVSRAIQRVHARGVRLVGLSNGVITLAEAGVLEGRRASAHWLWMEDFRRGFPSVRLDPDALLVDDGDILTSAGSSATIDLALHLVRLDYGPAVANSLSRQLLFAPHRVGGQQQFVERATPNLPDGPLVQALNWAREHLDQPLRVADIAQRAAVSQATLRRRFRTELGTTPLAWLRQERVALACRLIELGEINFETVAFRSGLGSVDKLRAEIRNETGLTPSAYLRQFGPQNLDGCS